MDTRYWGPSGWRLLHLMAEGGLPTEDARQFWLLLPFVLPCKFCRQSLTQYYKKYPVPENSRDLPKWLWSIHNCVNDKLRKQGLCQEDDPPFSQVKARSQELYKLGCTKTNFPGWRFLFCIADNHPAYGESTPMNDLPNPPPTDLMSRNEYNLLTAKERLDILKEWFQYIPTALPYKEWRESWYRHAKGLPTALKTRKNLLSWLYKIECGMEKDLNWLSQNSFHGLCRELKEHRSGCAKDLKAKTCRKITNKTKKNTRRG